MKSYRIKVISHLLKNGKIGKSGDVVKENQLISLDHSLKGGYVELVKKGTKSDPKVDPKVDPKNK